MAFKINVYYEAISFSLTTTLTCITRHKISYFSHVYCNPAGLKYPSPSNLYLYSKHFNLSRYNLIFRSLDIFVSC